MNLLLAFAGPMIFLAVCSGIYGVGDVVLFGKIGKKLIKRFGCLGDGFVATMGWPRTCPLDAFRKSVMIVTLLLIMLLSG